MAEEGVERKMPYWHNLGAIDEDEILRRIELHLDELPQNLSEQENRKRVLQLIEKRRRRIVEELQRENPEVLKKLKKSREKLDRRLEKQNPEAARRLHEWEDRIKGV